MTQKNDTIRVFIPLTLRRKNGRPRIVAPEPETHFQMRNQDPHILKALGRAWAWRRRLESGEAATVNDIGKAEGVSGRFVGRIIRLAFLSPDVIERLVISREPPSASIHDLCRTTRLPWAEQLEQVFEARRTPTSKGS